MDVLTTINGQADGTGKGLTTFPTSEDPEQQATHAECLALEQQGTIGRKVDNDGTTHAGGRPFIIWYPAADLPPAPPPPPPIAPETPPDAPNQSLPSV